MGKVFNIYYHNCSDSTIKSNNELLRDILKNKLKDKYDDINEVVLNSKISLYQKLKKIYKTGGLLITDDLLIINKDIELLLLNDVFFCYDNKDDISNNVIYARNIKNEFILEVINALEQSKSLKLKDIFKNMYKSINFDLTKTKKIADDVVIYSKEYFYPIGINRYEERITENLIAINNNRKLYENEKFIVNIIKKHGISASRYIITLKDVIRNKVGSKKYTLKRKINKTEIGVTNENNVINEAINKIEESYKDCEYIVFHNRRWLGVTSATKELFDNLINLEEITDKDYAKKLAKAICDNNVKQVILSAFCYGWETLCSEIKNINKDIKIKCSYHGSHSQIIETINYELYMLAINLHKNKVIDCFATCKESLIKLYEKEGFNTALLKNNVKLTKEIKEDIKVIAKNEKLKEKVLRLETKKDYNKNKIKIGIYSAGNDWRKNIYNQFAAASLIENSIIDTVVISDEISEFSKYHDIEVVGTDKRVERDRLLYKMSKNDINLYVTFSECAPMLPIESFEMNTVCITGNNHHYFNTKLKDMIVVNREDDVMDIYNKIIFCLDNKKEIKEEYKLWKKQYDKESIESVKKFLEY